MALTGGLRLESVRFFFTMTDLCFWRGRRSVLLFAPVILFASPSAPLFAASAQADLAVIYASVTSRASTAIPSELGSTTLFAGVYSSPTYFTLGAQLTLDARGDASAVFIFVRLVTIAVSALMSPVFF
jgi:hypothetical protein